MCAKCEVCGAETKFFKSSRRAKRFCSTRCRESQHRKYGLADNWKFAECAVCGERFTRIDPRQVVCGIECRIVRKRRISAERLRSYRISKEYTCQHCNVRFRPKARDRTKFCGRECAFAHKSEVSQNRQRRNSGRFSRGLSQAVVLWANRHGRHKTRCANGKPRKTFVCRACNQKKTHFIDGYAPVCRLCRNKARDSYELYSKRTNQRTVGKKSPLELQAWQIFREENFMCYLCGMATNPTAAKNDPLYPTVDHVLPRARGGTHKRNNLRCACRQCNSRKTDRTPVEYARITAIPKGYRLAEWLTQIA